MTMHERLRRHEEERYRCLRKQKILSDAVALRLAQMSDDESDMLHVFEKDQDLMVQDEDSQDVHFLLAGSVSILINHRHRNTRTAGTVIGEMGALEATSRRSATVRALERVVTIKVNYDLFLELLKEDDSYGLLELPTLLASRLREYSSKTRPQNEVIRVFIGSSNELAEYADMLCDCLISKDIDAVTWKDKSVFEPSGIILPSLLEQARRCDFALFIYGDDDVVRSRGKQYATPRDNIHLEVGMFMGALDSEKRVMLLVPDGKHIKIPSDLGGFIYQPFDTSSVSRFRVMAKQLAARISKLGPR